MELSYAKIYFRGWDVHAGGVLAGTVDGQTNQLLYVCAVKPGNGEQGLEGR